MASLLQRSENGTATGAPPFNPTIEPFTENLTGVNQEVNELARNILWWSLGGMALIVLCFRGIELVNSHLRHLFAMSQTGPQQAYFTRHRSTWWPWIKKHVLYAPLWMKRHNREIRLSSAMNVGTLPSRFQTILLSLYFLSNFVYCVMLDYSHKNKYQTLAELRGRSGVLSLANMIALVLLAGRNNPLISLLKISFDTYNLLHRWMGRMVVFEAIVHTLAWLVTELASAKWAGVWFKLSKDPFIGYGMVGTLAMVLILFTSPSIIRHAFYETFLNVHIVLAIVAIGGIYIHCDLGQLPSTPYILVVMGLWAADRLARFVRIVYYNFSRRSGWTNATVEALPGEACRVTLHLQAQANIDPGSHAYLRFGFSPLESHPFSIAWTADRPINAPSLLPLSVSDEKSSTSSMNSKHNSASHYASHHTPHTTDVSFVIHARTGMTRQLYNRALAAAGGNPLPGQSFSSGSGMGKPLRLKAAFEGPYPGSTHSLSSYGTLLLFAGSSGITHFLPYLSSLIPSSHASTSAVRRIVLVWIVRDVECLEWVRPWMDSVLRLPGRRGILTIKLFVTRPRSPREICSPSSSVQMFPGRPDVGGLVREVVWGAGPTAAAGGPTGSGLNANGCGGQAQAQAAGGRVGRTCVGVCGPGGLADSVRAATREVMALGGPGGEGNVAVDFVEECFTW